MTYLIFVALAYLLGSIPFGLLIGKWAAGIDVRQHGSQNIGATNVFRVVGKKWGILVFILDALKGSLAVLLPQMTGIIYPAPNLLVLAIISILGHSFPLWLSFKGGKGVATAFGVFVALCPLPALLAFAVFILVFRISHILSLGSLAAAITFPIMISLTYKGKDSFIWYLGVSLFLLCFIFYTHRKNIQRLRQGEEKKLF